ncbi:MAG: POTRA domain-containing protein, partial [Lysobacter sp.]
MRFPLRTLAAALILFAAGAAHAAKVSAVEIRGLDEPMTTNVRVALSLVDAIGKDVSGRRLAYLLREAEAETREALEPFGYYSPTITVERSGAADEAESDRAGPVSVTVTVVPGA